MTSPNEFEKGYGKLIQHIPLIIFSDAGAILQSNTTAMHIIGLKKADKGKSLPEAGFTVINEDGIPMKPDKHPWIRATRTNKMIANAITGLQTPDGHHRWLQTTSLPVPDPRNEHGRISITLVADITSRIDAKGDLETELQYMRALASCSAGLACPSDTCASCSTFKAVLRIPLPRMPLCSIHFFENNYDSSSRPCLACTCEISRRCSRKTPVHKDSVAWKPVLERWFDLLNQGKPIHGRTSDFTKEEAAFLANIGAASVAIFPVTHNKTWLASIMYCCDSPHHEWSDRELHILEAVSGIIGGMLGRKATRKAIVQSQQKEILGTLAAGMAHDFNNILAAIRASVQVLSQEHKHDHSIHNDLAEIQQEIQRGTDVVRQLQLFGHPSSMNLRTIRINDHIREMTNVFRHTMPKNIIFKLDLTEDDVMARIPPSQFDQILLNLALNSRDAMSEGGEIAISSSVVHHDSIEAVSLPELKPGIYVHVAVHDQGSGISPEILPKIFDPFFTTKKIGKGSGLGLSIVKTIVAEHNGHIQVESEKGKGTLVSFYLPAQMGTGADKKRKHVQEDRKQLSGTETILLADDEAVLTRCLARLFTRFGYQVVVADDGSKAFDLFNNSHSKIDLVVLDNEMPGLSGKQCMKKLLELAPRTRVILMSAHAMDKMSFDPIRDGAKAFLQKPFDIMDALKVVRRVLEETAISSPP